jgi:hypothetical protein
MFKTTKRALIVMAVIGAASAPSAAPASARTFDFNAVGSMVQQPLAPEWGCLMRQLVSGGKGRFDCRASSARTGAA